MITDFCLALDATRSITRAHQALGTPSHRRQSSEITEPAGDEGASGQLVGLSVVLGRVVSRPHCKRWNYSNASCICYCYYHRFVPRCCRQNCILHTIHTWRFVLNLRPHWWLNGNESACSAGDEGFNPWVRKSPWRRDWRPTQVFLPGESHGQRRLAGYGPWGRRVGHDLVARTARHVASFTRVKTLCVTQASIFTTQGCVFVLWGFLLKPLSFQRKLYGLT